jgi:hypothetical protein
MNDEDPEQNQEWSAGRRKLRKTLFLEYLIKSLIFLKKFDFYEVISNSKSKSKSK